MKAVETGEILRTGNPGSSVVVDGNRSSWEFRAARRWTPGDNSVRGKPRRNIDMAPFHAHEAQWLASRAAVEPGEDAGGSLRNEARALGNK